LDTSAFLSFSPAFSDISPAGDRQKGADSHRLLRRFIPQVVKWFAQRRLKSAGTITLTIPAEDDRLAFDQAENEPRRTIKAHLDFPG
jgi:hypothetical protein